MFSSKCFSSYHFSGDYVNLISLIQIKNFSLFKFLFSLKSHFLSFFLIFNIVIKNFHLIQNWFSQLHWVDINFRSGKIHKKTIFWISCWLPPKTLNFLRQHVKVEKDRQKCKGLTYQHHLFFQQKSFLLVLIFFIIINIYISIT